MAGREILLRMLEGFRTAVPGAEFREARLPRPAERMPAKPLVVGSVKGETGKENAWEAKIEMALFLPGAFGPGEAEAVLDGMTAWVKANEALYSGAQRGGFSVDKSTGCLRVNCEFSFERPSQGEGKARYPVTLNGTVYQAAGWKLSRESSGKKLTAIGEDEPFYQAWEDRIELRGLPEAALAVPDGFTLRLGETVYTGCRWKSVSQRSEASGTDALVYAGSREKAEEE